MNDQLEELETQLAQMSREKRLFVYSTILVCLVYISWSVFGESMSEDIEMKEERISSLEMKLMKNSNRSLEKAILKSKKDILTLEDSITHLHFQKQFIQTRLQSIDFIYFNEAGSAQILDDILKHSVSQRINLKVIEKVSIDNNNSEDLIQPKNHLLVSGAGNLRAIVSLHHYIESLNALLMTQSLHVSIDDNNATHFELNLIHYGVQL
ncbi:MAG: hypothetical protein U9R50_03575 [Campylobacterota bacterium]|nr:hypothetical protein [Campylobacterota bacterium]